MNSSCVYANDGSLQKAIHRLAVDAQNSVSSPEQALRVLFDYHRLCHDIDNNKLLVLQQ
ncbi:MAG: hypothetical protein WA941_01725 [Nitrososphaeraceae archaeon]